MSVTGSRGDHTSRHTCSRGPDCCPPRPAPATILTMATEKNSQQVGAGQRRRWVVIAGAGRRSLLLFLSAVVAGQCRVVRAGGQAGQPTSALLSLLSDQMTESDNNCSVARTHPGSDRQEAEQSRSAAVFPAAVFVLVWDQRTSCELAEICLVTVFLILSRAGRLRECALCRSPAASGRVRPARQ